MNTNEIQPLIARPAGGFSENVFSVPPAEKKPVFPAAIFRALFILMLVAGTAVAWKFVTVDAVSVYNKSFPGFPLSSFRGNVENDKMESAYRSSDWSAVIDAFHKQSAKTNKSYFLAGVAELQLKEYPSAVTLFEQVLNSNRKTGENYYQAESEYFVALAYLINNQSAKGVEMLRKIKKDVNHPYYPLASKISAADLQVLAFKK